MHHRFVPTLGLVFLPLLFLLACSSSKETGAPVADTNETTSDCVALGDKQVAARCPSFDAERALAACEDTYRRVSESCRPALHQLAGCLLREPITCTDAGRIDDETPAACKSDEATLSACR